MKRHSKGLGILGIMVFVAVTLMATSVAFPQKSEITFMIPPWGEPDPEALQKFTEETGIKVILNVIGWDEIRDKIIVAGVSKTAPADVVEVDWSWIGEFYASDLLEVLDVSEEDMKDMPTISSFTADGKVVALPYGNDFRIGYYNSEHFEKAGVAQVPETWDEVVEAAKAIKSSGVCEYPISFVLSATETCTTNLIWLTLARSGNFFNEDGTFNKDNFLATLQFVNKLVKEDKLIDPVMATSRDVEVNELFSSGASSFLIGSIGLIFGLNDPEQSAIAGKAKAMLIPGRKGVRTVSMALPEAVGIPKYSKNKEAARKFIDWYLSPEIQVIQYKRGVFPTRSSVLQELINKGEIPDGDVVLAQAKEIKPAFPMGIPVWYPEMSATIYNAVNEMVTADKPPEEVVEEIATKIEDLAKRK